MRSLNEGITGWDVDISFTVYFTGAENNFLLTALNSRQANNPFPEKNTKRIAEADIKLLNHVGDDSLQFGWYRFAEIKIFLTNVERLSCENIEATVSMN